MSSLSTPTPSYDSRYKENEDMQDTTIKTRTLFDIEDKNSLQNGLGGKIGELRAASNVITGESQTNRNYLKEFLESIPDEFRKFFESLPSAAQNAIRIASGYWNPNDEKPHDQIVLGKYLVALVGMGNDPEKLKEGLLVAQAYIRSPAEVIASIENGTTVVVVNEDVLIASTGALDKIMELPGDAELMLSTTDKSNLEKMTEAVKARRAQRIEERFGIPKGEDQEEKYQAMLAKSKSIVENKALTEKDRSAALSGLLFANSAANKNLGLVSSSDNSSTLDLQKSWKEFLGNSWEDEIALEQSEARATYQKIIQVINEELQSTVSLSRRLFLHTARAVTSAMFAASEFRYWIHARSEVDAITTGATSSSLREAMRSRIFERLIQCGIPSDDD